MLVGVTNTASVFACRLQNATSSVSSSSASSMASTVSRSVEEARMCSMASDARFLNSMRLASTSVLMGVVAT